MATSKTSNGQAVSEFVRASGQRSLPPEVMNAALLCIVDWFGVALGADDQEPVQSLKRVVQGWRAQGNAQVLLGPTSTATAAALVNGTMAHCLDFDDTHVGSIAHLSGPAFAAALAVGNECNATPREIINAFVTGFEVGGRLGNARLGVSINERHIHSTGVFGCLAAAAAAAALYKLDDLGVQRAMGLAATQVAGLTGSFGTPAKPFHAGKAAFNGVLAAQMAREGFHGGLDLLEGDGGLARALVQDQSVGVHAVDFGEGWEITRNTLKPYASCLLTHPVIDAARKLYPDVRDKKLEKIRVHVNPLAIQLAGKPAPTTPFEGKFSLAFCTALALRGHVATQTDFTAATVVEPRLQELVRIVELVPVPDMVVTAARLELLTRDGESITEYTPLALGNPGRPMSWDDMRNKFVSLVAPSLSGQGDALFEALRTLDRQEQMERVLQLVSARA